MFLIILISNDIDYHHDILIITPSVGDATTGVGQKFYNTKLPLKEFKKNSQQTINIDLVDNSSLRTRYLIYNYQK